MAYLPSCSTRINDPLSDLATLATARGEDDNRPTGAWQRVGLASICGFVTLDLIPYPLMRAGLILLRSMTPSHHKFAVAASTAASSRGSLIWLTCCHLRWPAESNTKVPRRAHPDCSSNTPYARAIAPCGQ